MKVSVRTFFTNLISIVLGGWLHFGLGWPLYWAAAVVLAVNVIIVLWVSKKDEEI
jgi:hypothetical protein